jgi:hypothetical protein
LNCAQNRNKFNGFVIHFLQHAFPSLDFFSIFLSATFDLFCAGNTFNKSPNI